MLGARPGHIVSRLTARLLASVCAGAMAGIAGGWAFGRYVETLLYETDPSDPGALVVPLVSMAVAALLAVLLPAMRAVRTDPARVIVAES